MAVCDVRLVGCQRIVELVVTRISKNSKEGPQTYAVVFNCNTLLILPFEGVPKETDGKVHSGGPHAVSVNFLG